MDAHRIAAIALALIAIICSTFVLVRLRRMTRELQRMRQQCETTCRPLPVLCEASVVDVERRR